MLNKLQYNLAKLLNFPINPLRDERVKRMGKEIKERKGLKFHIRTNKNGWIAECINLKGIITGNTNVKPTKEEIDLHIKDAIFSTFNIPPYLCDDRLIKRAGSNEETERDSIKISAKELVYGGLAYQ